LKLYDYVHLVADNTPIYSYKMSGRLLHSLYCYPMENYPLDKVVIKTLVYNAYCMKNIYTMVPYDQLFLPTSDEEAWMRGCMMCKGSTAVKQQHNFEGYINWFRTLQVNSLGPITARGGDHVDGTNVSLDDAALTRSLHEAVESGDITSTMEISPVDEHGEVVVSEAFQFGNFHSFYHERLICGWEKGQSVSATTGEDALKMYFFGRGQSSL
jgi:hypothetical protein